MTKISISSMILGLHRQALIIDGHADTFGKVLESGIGFFKHTVRKRHVSRKYWHLQRHIDYHTLRQSGTKIQFMAIYTPPQYQLNQATMYALKMLSLIRKTVDDNRNQIKLVCSRSDMRSLRPANFLMTLESGSPLNGQLSFLHLFYRLGVRCLTLTHNPRNELGDGIGVKRPRGLTRFGKSVVKECARLGVLVDVAHLSYPGFKDVVKLAQQPIISSHSGVKALCDVSRNLDDEQIKFIAQTKGVIAIFYIPHYLKKFKGKKDSVSLSDVVDHIAYVADKVGVDYVGLGSDFDGYQGDVKGLENARYLPNLTQELANRGFNKAEIKKILGGNFSRVIKSVLR